ncbi:MAG: hypothetical protein JSV32_07325 [Dehalococcoidia bacterium]|nr:MAG: hypothetical protein JSV32_07325 [Dehalococcoidia bacterium]
MPRPMYIYKNVVEQKPAQNNKNIRNLLGEILDVSDKASKCLAKCIKILTTKHSSQDVDIHIVDLLVRAWNDFKVTCNLVKMGFYLQAIMVLRDTIEIMAIVEYLHKFPEKANDWWKAKTTKERRYFSINNIKDSIENGEDIASAWNNLSSYIHPNGCATPWYGADKPYYGHNLFLNGFYYPSSAEFVFTLQLHLCIDFLNRLNEWYSMELRFPKKLTEEIISLKDEYNLQVKNLEKRMKVENKEVVDKVLATRLTDEEVIKWFQSFEDVK